MHHGLRRLVAVATLSFWYSIFAPAYAGDGPLAGIAKARKEFEVEVQRIEAELQANVAAFRTEFLQSKKKHLNREIELQFLEGAIAGGRRGGLANGRLAHKFTEWGRPTLATYEGSMEAACDAVIRTYERSIADAAKNSEAKVKQQLSNELTSIIEFRDGKLLQPADRCIRDFRLTASSTEDWFVIAQAYSAPFLEDGRPSPLTQYAFHWDRSATPPTWKRNLTPTATWHFTDSYLKTLIPTLSVDPALDPLLVNWSHIKTVTSLRQTIQRYGQGELSNDARKFLRQSMRELENLRWDFRDTLEHIAQTEVVETDSDGRQQTRGLSIVEELGSAFIGRAMVSAQNAMLDNEIANQFVESTRDVVQRENEIWFHLQDILTDLPRAAVRREMEFEVTASYSPQAFPETLAIENTTSKKLTDVVIAVELRQMHDSEPTVIGCAVNHWPSGRTIDVVLPDAIACQLRPAPRGEVTAIRLTIANRTERLIDQELKLLPGSKSDPSRTDAILLQLEPIHQIFSSPVFLRSSILEVHRHNASIREAKRCIQFHFAKCLKIKKSFSEEAQDALASDVKQLKRNELPTNFQTQYHAKVKASRTLLKRRLKSILADARQHNQPAMVKALESHTDMFEKTAALETIALPSTAAMVSINQQSQTIANLFDTFIAQVEKRSEEIEKQLIAKMEKDIKRRAEYEMQLAELQLDYTIPAWCRSREQTAIKSALQKLGTDVHAIVSANPSIGMLDGEVKKLNGLLREMYGPLLAQLK